MLAHNVYFSLKDKSAETRDRLLEDCRTLGSIPGVALFGCGTVVPDLDRPVNVRDFDVGLHVMFESRAAHDAYQVSEAHQAFVARNKEGWEHVRIFDSEWE